MKYEVKVDEQRYTVEAPNTYEAKVQAARQHAKKYPSNFTSGVEVLAKSKIIVIPIEGNR